ncbi:SWI-SNF complex subunit [Cryomyces antarcticus]
MPLSLAVAQSPSLVAMIRLADLDATFINSGPMVTPSHPPPSLTPQQIAQAQAQEAQKRELNRRQSRKPTDKNIPDDVADVTIGDGVAKYRQLREAERRLDAIMMRKRLDVQDSVNRNVKEERVLRIWVSNTADGQPWQKIEEGGGMEDDGAFDFGSDSSATYRVKIEGRLLDAEVHEAGEEATDNGAEADKDAEAVDHGSKDVKKTPPKAAPKPAQRTKLSHFFKAINIDFDRSRSLQPDGFTSIEWKKPADARPGIPNASADANFDTLEFERQSDENINITINLVRDETPERYKLSKPLAEILDAEEEDRAGVVMGIWEYVKAMNLQEDEEHRRIQCDDRLKAVFGTDTLFFPYIPDLTLPHLTPLEPLHLPYTIRVDKDYITNPTKTVYDVLVPVPSPLRHQLQSLGRVGGAAGDSYLSTLTAISSLDDALALTIQKINQTNAKRKFFESLAREPAGFVKRWISSQKRDLEVIAGEAGRAGGEDGSIGEEFRRGGRESVWGGEIARESVGLWLAKGSKPH